MLIGDEHNSWDQPAKTSIAEMSTFIKISDQCPGGKFPPKFHCCSILTKCKIFVHFYLQCL